MRARLLTFALSLAAGACSGQPPARYSAQYSAQAPPIEVPARLRAEVHLGLPTASEAYAKDDDPSVRVVINLDANGAILVAMNQVTFLELKKILRAEKVAWCESGATRARKRRCGSPRSARTARRATCLFGFPCATGKNRPRV
jgi:hypothetical protein